MVNEPGAQATQRPGRTRAALRTGAVAALLALGGCGGRVSFETPFTVGHDREGGPIADQRPPPPGVDDPFPNLGSIPKRPSPTDPTTRQNIADALSADRTLAEREASLVPIAPPAPASVAKSAPPAPAAGTNAPPATSPDQGGGISASLDAASAPPPPRAASPPPAAATPDPFAGMAPPPAPSGTAAAQAAPVQPGPLPALPDKPPAAPVLPGVAIPTMPPPAPAITGPAPVAPPLPANGPDVLALNFAPQSAILPESALAPLHAFAGRRGKRSIVITGRGEAASSNADVQAAALALGVERAQAIAAALTAAGTSPGAIRLATDAAGRGAWLRLVD